MRPLLVRGGGGSAAWVCRRCPVRPLARCGVAAGLTLLRGLTSWVTWRWGEPTQICQDAAGSVPGTGGVRLRDGLPPLRALPPWCLCLPNALLSSTQPRRTTRGDSVETLQRACFRRRPDASRQMPSAPSQARQPCPAQVLHESRTRAPWAKQPAAAAALRRLADAHSLYVAPHGSNDDWYWMYAAVRAGARAGLCAGARWVQGCTFARGDAGPHSCAWGCMPSGPVRGQGFMLGSGPCACNYMHAWHERSLVWACARQCPPPACFSRLPLWGVREVSGAAVRGHRGSLAAPQKRRRAAGYTLTPATCAQAAAACC